MPHEVNGVTCRLGNAGISVLNPVFEVQILDGFCQHFTVRVCHTVKHLCTKISGLLKLIGLDADKDRMRSLLANAGTSADIRRFILPHASPGLIVERLIVRTRQYAGLAKESGWSRTLYVIDRLICCSVTPFGLTAPPSNPHVRHPAPGLESPFGQKNTSSRPPACS